MTGIMLGPRMTSAGTGGGGTVILANQDVMGTDIAVWRIMANGTTTYHDGTGVFTGPAWINPKTGMELYEVKVELAVDSHPLQIDDGLGVWLPCSGSPQWGYSWSLPRMGQLEVEIRRIADAVVVGSATIFLETAGSLEGGGGGGGGGPLP